MKRVDIEKEYKVDEYGLIRNPGKFEGECLYTPYFWDFVMNGVEDRYYFDEDGTPVSEFLVTKEDIDEFPELEGVRIVAIREDDVGFVYCEVVE